MAKIYEGLLSKNIPREKRQDSFDPQRVNSFGDDSICMVNNAGNTAKGNCCLLLHD